jgi:hypothetical protein
VNKNFGIAIVAGSVVMFLVGYLMFGMALAGFYESVAGSATGVVKDPPEWLWLILSTVLYTTVLALVLNWAGSKDAVSGFKTAAIFGLLMGAAFDFGQYSMTNLMTLTGALVDPIFGAIHSGIGGAVVGMMLGKGGGDA